MGAVRALVLPTARAVCARGWEEVRVLRSLWEGHGEGKQGCWRRVGIFGVSRIAAAAAGYDTNQICAGTT